MYKKLLVIGILSLGGAPLWAQALDSTINKCDNKKGPIIYTEFDCPEGYELITDGWLSETNMTQADKVEPVDRSNNAGSDRNTAGELQ